eukprot:CAMPEP_0115220466 /NCGR_PEP_ID=MMETSP0270-20121206/27460_1 /TAXON_ID=71861 /ORGANISM="Scrippsiella trochoidea, Strain CCMP3099" /LENGTH=167 /DNA_ID=CAMNT_0002634519 /DNA_START=637 /DNA_END=1136 /DNA_ORIENTATION=-
MPPFAPRRPSAGGEPKSSPRFEGPCSATGQTSPAPPAFREGGVAGGAHHDWGGLRSTKGKLVDRVGPPRVAVSPTTSSCVWHCSASAASSALSCSTVNPSWSLGPGVDGVAALRHEPRARAPALLLPQTLLQMVQDCSLALPPRSLHHHHRNQELQQATASKPHLHS